MAEGASRRQVSQLRRDLFLVPGKMCPGEGWTGVPSDGNWPDWEILFTSRRGQWQGGPGKPLDWQCLRRQPEGSR